MTTDDDIPPPSYPHIGERGPSGHVTCLSRQMEPSTIAPWVIIALLILAVAGLIMWMAKRTRIAGERREADARQHEQETETLRAAHEHALAAAREQHHSEVTAAQDEHSRQLEGLRSSIKAHKKLQSKAIYAAAQGMKWELASRQQLVTACEKAGLDAVIATNLVFAPNTATDTPFCAQIDHLVITDNVVLIVESKHWTGLIFDGIRPSDHLPALAAIIDDGTLEPPFAAQLSRSSNNFVEVRFDDGDHAPARQARQQALRLRELLRTSMTPPLVDTCVFYSHPTAHVVTSGSFVERGMTTVVATAGTVHDVIRAAHESRQNRLGADGVTKLTDAIRPLGADLVGVGRFEAEFTSPVRLGYRIRGKEVSPKRTRPHRI